MLISPPFLPAPLADDEAFVAAAMPDGVDIAPGSGGAPLGSYPLTTALTWHNGLHIRAPQDAQNQPLPVRAIADGTVIFKREPRAAVAAADDPQNYNPYGLDPAWTDNGIVILRHATEIGAAGTVPTTLAYYSVYMHLSRIEAAIAEGRTVWRKDPIGSAGRILGRENHLHFEICLDPSNLQHLLGTSRSAIWTEPAAQPRANGRTDSVFGCIYIYLPAGTPTSTSKPTDNLQRTGVRPGASAASDHFVPNTLHNSQWVEICYREGASVVRSYWATGAQAGNLLGSSLTEPDFEYDMYTEACARHNSLGAALQANSSPSGWYELLRFGRNLGPDPLPANAAHWRQIPVTSGTVWVDLNAPGTFKFSDADFPGFLGWQCFEDDTSHDNQRCDSPHMKRLLRDPKAPENWREREALARRLGDADIRKKLERAICRFPTEWDRDTIAKRYDWLKVDEEFRVEEGKEWDEFKAHAESISFEGLPQEYKNAVWHVHPRMFIAHMRKCGWRSKKELAQLIPMNVIRKPGSHRSAVPAVWESPGLRAAQALLETHAAELNFALRKYLISTPIRQACFFANATQETQWFSQLQESNGRSPTLHAGWYGRGFLQLTNPNGNINGGNNNYYKYFRFIGKNPVAPPSSSEILWRDEIGNDARHAAQSAGAYWIWPGKVAPNPRNPGLPTVGNTNRYADLAGVDQNQRNLASVSQGGSKVWYYNQSFVNCAAAVNYPATVGQSPPNMNGLIDRSTAFTNALIVLLDVVYFQNAQGHTQNVPENFSRRLAS
ncbi:M23 family metallopeptidase [Acidovorax cavernicola]|uniref:M23 family peptidase n=1 Tax=Acidovorax cavernicola TaxID=1675792 RepID=A0A9X8CZK4_9BURK|nr:M23 family metallopeptidase [Acidovorax cavernicola]RIX73250.1 M23 family peptidase [Acidovorax cavernicola]